MMNDGDDGPMVTMVMAMVTFPFQVLLAVVSSGRKLATC